jgi:hypothetical protein
MFHHLFEAVRNHNAERAPRCESVLLQPACDPSTRDPSQRTIRATNYSICGTHDVRLLIIRVTVTTAAISVSTLTLQYQNRLEWQRALMVTTDHNICTTES